MPPTSKAILFVIGKPDGHVAEASLLRRILITGRQAGLQEWHLLIWNDPTKVRSSLMAKPDLGDIVCHLYDMCEVAQTPWADVLPAEEVMVMSAATDVELQWICALQTYTATTLGLARSALEEHNPVLDRMRNLVGQAHDDLETDRLAAQSTVILRCYGTLLGHILDDRREKLMTQHDPMPVVIAELMEFADLKMLDLQSGQGR